MKKKPLSAASLSSVRDAAELKQAVQEVLQWLQEHSSTRVREGMARYAIPSDKALGVSVGEMRRYAKSLGQDQSLSLALWQTDVYEGRMMAVFLGEPQQVSSKQMDHWCADFDSWAICDTACFHLFDQSTRAFTKIHQWVKNKGEFQRRAAFALLASVSPGTDEDFIQCLPLIEQASTDERHFVKKAVNWALRSIGNQNLRLHGEAVTLASRLAESPTASARWIGKDALRQLASAATQKRVSRAAKAQSKNNNA